MRATIVVLNYNYGRFLARAIDSALAQTAPEVEVVVVDNGSTDDSRQVIERYTGRVRVVLQPENIGQGHGYNLGFEAARGDWIVWLDADDTLDPDCIQTCLTLADETTAKVQYPLRLIDAEDRPLGGVVPYVRHDGDVVPLIRRFGHYGGPPGSGNLYRRSAIAPYFPVKTADWPICTDTVPFVTAPFHGRVVDSGRPLGCYRLHRVALPSTPGYRGNYSKSIGSEVVLNRSSRDKTLAMLRDRSGIEVPGPFLTIPVHMRHRVVSWRLDPQAHPFPEDDAAGLRRLMFRSLREFPGYTALDRLVIRLWTLGVLYLPRPLAHGLMSARQSALLGTLMRWTRGFA
jgi:hypothetical protein